MGSLIRRGKLWWLPIYILNVFRGILCSWHFRCYCPLLNDVRLNDLIYLLVNRGCAYWPVTNYYFSVIEMISLFIILSESLEFDSRQ